MMQTFTLTFTEQQLQVLNAALIEIPFKHAAPLVQHINAEIQKTLATTKPDKSANVTYHESLPEMQHV